MSSAVEVKTSTAPESQRCHMCGNRVSRFMVKAPQPAAAPWDRYRPTCTSCLAEAVVEAEGTG